MGQSSLHATCLIVGEAGVLIRGRSGAGKSKLARALMSEAAQRGLFARLVGDDRVSLEALHGRLIARGHPEIAGLIEARGLGILRGAAEPACVIRLVVDLADETGARIPERADRSTIIESLVVPRLSLGPEADRADLVFGALQLSKQPIVVIGS